MRYGIGYSAEQYSTLREVKQTVQAILTELAEDNGLDLVYQVTRDGSEAVKEVKITVQLVDH